MFMLFGAEFEFFRLIKSFIGNEYLPVSKKNIKLLKVKVIKIPIYIKKTNIIFIFGVV